MKGYVFATSLGRCAFNHEHTWTVWTKILRVQGVGWPRAKDYCWACAEARWSANEQTAEFSYGVTAAPAPAVRPLNGLAERFDVKLAAAGRDD